MTLEEKLADEVAGIMQEINIEILETIAYRLKTVGDLRHTEVHELRQIMLLANMDLLKLERTISRLTGEALDDIDQIFWKAAEENAAMADIFYKAKNLPIVPVGEKVWADRIIESAIKDAKGGVLNISKTLAFDIDGLEDIRTAYLKTVNRAVLQVQSGAYNFDQVLRKTIKDTARSGVRTAYWESGYSRRIDSQARMSVLDGIRNMNRQIREEQGKEFGSDGVFIQQKGLCALDHLPHQGKAYDYKAFESLNNSLSRPIATGAMNCGHVAYDVILEVFEPPTGSELKSIAETSLKKVRWKGKEMNRYQASQEMRRAELKIRKLHELEAMAEKSGDKNFIKGVKDSISMHKKEYVENCKAVGLEPRLEKTALHY